MKVRYGVGLGADVAPEKLPGIVDHLESSGVDSLWFSELVYAPGVDPFVGMTFALARAAVFDESLELLRTVLRDRNVTFEGKYFSVRDVDILPKPAAPLDIWLGGATLPGFRRIAAYADGWLGSFLTPSEARQARLDISAAADAGGRHIPDDHYGINLAVGEGELPGAVLNAIRRRRPDLDPTELVATDWEQLHRKLDDYIAAGLTKFVIRPAGGVGSDEFIDRFAKELLPRQN